jgi:DNA-binding transcriptional ArsR family regulator
MPETLFQKDVRIKRVTTIGYRAAQALNDPLRIKILEILSHKQMSAEEIVKALASSDFKKATTTIRHHLDTLKSAGLIQATKMVEVRGAVMKYYSSTLRAFSYDTPADLEANNAKLVEDTSSKLLKVLKSVFEDKKFAAALDNKNNGCNLCKNDHFREYLALEILNAALAKAMERKEYGELISTHGKESGVKPSKA